MLGEEGLQLLGEEGPQLLGEEGLQLLGEEEGLQLLEDGPQLLEDGPQLLEEAVCSSGCGRNRKNPKQGSPADGQQDRLRKKTTPYLSLSCLFYVTVHFRTIR